MFKHKILIVCAGLLLILTPKSFSQAIGIKAGPVYNHFISSQQHVKGNPGIVAGASYYQSFGGSIGLVAGLEYLQLGGGLLTIEDDTRFGVDPYANPFAIKIRDSKVVLHTVNLPVLLNLKLIPGDAGGLTLGIGPEVSYTVSATSYDIVSSPQGATNFWVTYTQTRNETNNYAPFNVAGSVNLGVNFMAGGAPMAVDFRYRFGALPIRGGYSYLDLADSRSELYQGSFIVTIAYKLNFTSNNE